MSFFQAKPDWLLVFVFYVLINSSLHCTFRSVTGSFNASLMATFDETTEEECMSKCSMVLECTFMNYYEGTCRTFKYGTEVQEVDSVSRAFAYSFDEEETSCLTVTVSRPQGFTKKPTDVKKSIEEFCNGTYELAEWEAITKKSLSETPDDIRTCLFSLSSSHLNNCTLPMCKHKETTWHYTTDDVYFEPCGSEGLTFVCANYDAVSPYAVTEYVCRDFVKFVAIIDTEAEPNSEFPDFAQLRRNKRGRIFYVPEVNCSAF